MNLPDLRENYSPEDWIVHKKLQEQIADLMHLNKLSP